MNHDYAHCADFTEDCPKKCFRAQLVRDLQRYGKLAPYGINFPISWVHFKDTKDYKKKIINVPNRRINERTYKRHEHSK